MELKYTQINDGTKVPLLGLGTWQIKGNDCINSVATALDIGYKHIDTADIYGNHKEVGEGIAESGIQRNEIFLTTKLWRSEFEPEKVVSNIKRFLTELQTDYLDLVLIHWPRSDVEIDQILIELHKFKSQGVIKNLGISNFTIELMEDLFPKLDELEINLVNHQFELHPSLYQKDLVDYSLEKHMTVTAYSPVGQTEDFDLPEVKKLSEKYNVSPAEVILAWIMSKNLIAIPRSRSREHIQKNFDSQNLNLETNDIELLDQIQLHRRLVKPDFAPF